MSKINSEQLAACLATVPHDVAGYNAGHEGDPVLFAGSPVRFLGFATAHWQADNLAIANRVSATYCSRAQVKMPNGTMSRTFYVLHG